jgi:hypothetical protein
LHAHLDDESISAGSEGMDAGFETINASLDLMNASLDPRETVFDVRHFGAERIDLIGDAFGQPRNGLLQCGFVVHCCTSNARAAVRPCPDRDCSTCAVMAGGVGSSIKA